MNFVKFYLFVIYFITFNGGEVKCVYGDVNKSTSANSIINNTTKQPLKDCSETIMKEVELLKQEVDKVLRLSDVEYETTISRYLGRNFTLRKREFDVGNSTKTTRDSKTFMEKVKEKFGNFLDFFRRIGTKNLEAETRMKRCLMEDSYEDFDDESGFDNFPPIDEISIDEKTLTSMTSDELEKYLKKLIKCINSDEPSKQRYEGAFSINGNDTHEKIDENSDYHTKSSFNLSDDQAASHNCSIQNNTQAEATTKHPASLLDRTTNEQQPADNKFHKLSKFLANVQHPVELTGKLPQKSINLENINEFLKKLKSFNQDLSYNNEEFDSGKETTEATDDPVFSGIDPNFQVKRNARNVFDDFSKSISGLLVNEKSKQASNSRDNKDFIEERKSSQLMESLETPRVEKEAEEEPVQENVHEEEMVNEGEGLQNDLDGFKSRINPGQQVEIMNFLKQLNQGPKPFSFDTESFFQSQIDKLDHSKNKQTNEDTNTSNSIGRKYFEFEAEEKKDGNKPVDVVKRNSESDNNWEELKNIAKIKSKLIYDYKNYHSDISQFLHDYKKPEVSKHEINMVDNYFLLNDGKTKLEDFMKKPERVDSKMNLFDLNLDLQLDKEFQDLEYEKQLNQKSMFPSIDDDVSKIPLKKPFEFINTEDYLP
ncbi:unnamed protein product [Diamesa tonsa]